MLLDLRKEGGSSGYQSDPLSGDYGDTLLFPYLMPALVFTRISARFGRPRLAGRTERPSLVSRRSRNARDPGRRPMVSAMRIATYSAATDLLFPLLPRLNTGAKNWPV